MRLVFRVVNIWQHHIIFQLYHEIIDLLLILKVNLAEDCLAKIFNDLLYVLLQRRCKLQLQCIWLEHGIGDN